MSNARNLSKLFSLSTYVTALTSLAGNRTALEGTLTGSVAQVVETDLVTSGTTTSQIPTDDTIPQITEGTEIITASITPKYATSTLYVEATINCATNTAGSASVAAVFQNAAVNALGAAFFNSAGVDYGHQVTVRFKVTAKTTATRTFRVRVGPNSAVTLTYNGNAASRRFGGVSTSSLKITEVLA